MDFKETIRKINKDRGEIEAAWVFSLWKDPDLFGDYPTVNTKKDNTLQDDDAIFYFTLGSAMYHQGFRTFDNITVHTFLTNKKEIKEEFDNRGGYHTVEQLMNLVSTDNIDAYYDKIAKLNSLTTLCKGYERLFSHVEQFDTASNEDVFNTFDLLNTSVSLTTNRESEIESLEITDDDLELFNEGYAVGLNYGEICKILNYTTLGIPVSDIMMIAGHSGTGKSSFVFNNMAVPLANQGIKVAILSNEMLILAYKNMLLARILVYDLDYWDLTRKKIKIGGFDERGLEMLNKAKQISKERYKDTLFFIKLFDNDGNIVMKHMKRANRKYGISVFVWDTFKGDDSVDDKMWQQLLMSSRKVFNLVSKEHFSMIMTFQLALYTTNQRWLDAGCLSSSKQIKEVLSELIMIRKLWADEYSGEKYDCHPYKLDPNNKKIKINITLDPNKTYVVAFINKTRNDEDSKNIIYEWRGAWNYWKEIGWCTIQNDHRGIN